MSDFLNKVICVYYSVRLACAIWAHVSSPTHHHHLLVPDAPELPLEAVCIHDFLHSGVDDSDASVGETVQPGRQVTESRHGIRRHLPTGSLDLAFKF